MKRIQTLWMMITCFIILTLANACSKDDLPDVMVSDMDGKRVSSVGGCKIKYDEKDRPYKFIGYDGENVEIDYDKNKLYFDEVEYNLKFHKGLISEMTFSIIDNSDSYQSRHTGKYTFSYDKDNCLTKMTEDVSGKIQYDDKDYAESISLRTEQNFKWRNGNLRHIAYNGVEDYDGKEYVFSSDIEIEYGYEENRFRQFPLGFLYNFEDFCDVLFAVGLFGNGPVNLPDEMIISEEEDDEFYDYTRSFSFALNSNGTIKSEKYGVTTISYGYSTLTRADESDGLVRLKFEPWKRLKRRVN